MTNNIQKINSNTYQLSEDNNNLGTISTYTNDYHNTYLYLSFHLLSYPTYSPFPTISQNEGRNLQAMVDSSQEALIHFLTKNGFQLKRRCFSPAVSKTDLKHPLKTDLEIYKFDNQDERYSECCNLLYDYYKKTHACVSPLTISRDTFIKEVPTKTGYYHLTANQIDNLIFTENNEIAYVCSTNQKNCRDFIQSVLNVMFNSHKQLFFEADDTDWAATMLLDQFKYDPRQSYNTYIFDN